MRRALTLLLIGLAACTESTGPDGSGPVAVVEVTPLEAVITTVGGTAQFAARPADADGVRVEDATVTWRSSNPAVVTVDKNGLATAVANGSATVTAQVEGVYGDAAATVCAQPIQVTLAVGQAHSAPIGCSIRLPAGAAGDRYRVAIVRLSAVPDATAPTVTLQMVSGGLFSTRAPAALAWAEEPTAALPLSAAQAAMLERASATVRATAAAHTRIREAEDLLLRSLGPQPVLPLATGLSPVTWWWWWRARVSGEPVEPTAVSAPKRTFFPRSASSTSCSAVPQGVTGLLVAENADVAIYQDSAQAQTPSRVTASQAQRVLEFYSSFGKPVIESAFGPMPDRDANGQVIVLVTPELSGGAGATAAFVWGGDQLARSACPASNEMELVYYNAVMFTKLDQGDFQAAETLVHEVKHIVSFFQRLSGNVFSIGPSWAEEGGAEIAGEKASRRAMAAKGGTPENGVITAASFPGNRFTIENYGVVLRIFNSIKYLATQPNAVVFAATGAPYTVYGSGWHFNRFLGDAYGSAASGINADAPFFLRQTSSATPVGLNGLPVLTGKSFATLMVEYAAAVMLNGTGSSALVPAFTTYDFPSAATVISQGGPAGRYPYAVTGTPNNSIVPFTSGSWSGPIGNGGLRIHDFTSTGASSAEISVSADQPARVVVVRLR